MLSVNSHVLAFRIRWAWDRDRERGSRQACGEAWSWGRSMGVGLWRRRWGHLLDGQGGGESTEGSFYLSGPESWMVFFLFLVSPEHAPACTSRAVDIIMYSPYDLSHIKYGLYQPRGQQLRTKGWHWLSWPQQSGSQLGGCTGCRP